MGFTQPTARGTGYVVQATDWNVDIAYNVAWLGSNVVGSGLALAGRPSVLAVETSDQSIPNNTITAVTFNDTELYDVQSQHDTTANTSRITCGATANIGLYHFHASGLWASNATGQRYAALRLNGTTELYRVGTSSNAATAMGWSVSGYYRLTAITDYMEVVVFQNSGGALALSASVLSSKFAALWVSA